MNISFKKIKIFAVILGGLNAVFWSAIIIGSPEESAEAYFLNVGQGDSELVRAGRANFLIDSGKDSLVLNGLEEIISNRRKRIDVAFVSHGQSDHAGGMFYVIKNYDIGYVVYNGDDTPLWKNLKQELIEKDIPYVILSAGDRIVYGQNAFDVLWPRILEQKSGSNDNSMVIKYKNENYSALFTADISSKTESKLLSGDIASDIIKVPHHGSKYSSSKSFLAAVAPKISVIEVGKNSYGHPTADALSVLRDVGSKIFRTDKDGLLKIGYLENKLSVSAVR